MIKKERIIEGKKWSWFRSYNSRVMGKEWAKNTAKEESNEFKKKYSYYIRTIERKEINERTNRMTTVYDVYYRKK